MEMQHRQVSTQGENTSKHGQTHSQTTKNKNVRISRNAVNSPLRNMGYINLYPLRAHMEIRPTYATRRPKTCNILEHTYSTRNRIRPPKSGTWYTNATPHASQPLNNNTWTCIEEKITQNEHDKRKLVLWETTDKREERPMRPGKLPQDKQPADDNVETITTPPKKQPRGKRYNKKNKDSS